MGLLVLALASAAAATTIKGVVKDVDGRTRVIVLEDGPRSSTVPPARPRTGETVLMTGTVARVDSSTKTLVLQDGREVKLDDRSVILMDGRSVPLASLTPGTRVTVTSEPLMVQESALPRAAVETAAVGRRGEATFDPARVEPWPSSVPESEMMLEPQAP